MFKYWKSQWLWSSTDSFMWYEWVLYHGYNYAILAASSLSEQKWEDILKII